MVLFLSMHAEHFGPRGINMRMAIATKRSLGVSAKFIGGTLLTVGALAYIEREKVLRTDGVQCATSVIQYDSPGASWDPNAVHHAR